MLLHFLLEFAISRWNLPLHLFRTLVHTMPLEVPIHLTLENYVACAHKVGLILFVRHRLGKSPVLKQGNKVILRIHVVLGLLLRLKSIGQLSQISRKSVWVLVFVLQGRRGWEPKSHRVACLRPLLGLLRSSQQIARVLEMVMRCWLYIFGNLSAFAFLFNQLNHLRVLQFQTRNLRWGNLDLWRISLLA